MRPNGSARRIAEPKTWLLSLFAIFISTVGIAEQKNIVVHDDWTSLSEFVGKQVTVRGYLGFSPNKGREYGLYNLTRKEWVKLVVDNFNTLPAAASAGKVVVTVEAEVIRAPIPKALTGQSRLPAPNECFLDHVRIDGVKIRSSTDDEEKKQ